MNNNYEKITDSNNVIYENLTKIYEKIFLLKNTYNLEEDDEYEEFYNRISFYFSNILAQIKLKYIESIKVLEEKNKNNEKDILNLIMENMLLKIENEYLEEKNMFNLSNYIELKNSEKNSFENEGKEYIKNNKIRNKYSNIIFEKDFLFQNDIKNNINSKIKKKINFYNNSNTQNSYNIFNTNLNLSKNKKSNLTNFINNGKLINISNKNLINHKQNAFSIQCNSRNENLKYYHYKNNTEDNVKNIERSMYNLPIKNNLKDTNLSNLNIKKKKNRSCPKGNTKIVSVNLSGNKSTNNLLNNLTKQNNKYQRNLLNKINSIHNTNMKGIINMKMKNNK